MEAAQERVKNAVTSMIRDLDRDYFRKMQVKMYEDSANCCRNESLSMEDTQRCIERCTVSVQQAQHFMESELAQLQNRLQRCAMDCQDKARDEISKNSSSSGSRYKYDVEGCMVKCADSHLELIPNIKKRVKEFVNQGSS
ncbi:DgyrCDS5513 [Dimorphilus gyrociliatus]|uniref:DgyrCDS5513 n=1 Tax=Dimorphilus gyrociliatus TaxID=2664684 RepID=A0A7I8VLQ5_9ANNE|nr:DgyrCDS5513 [Dimorphilus gyrociliatus]